MFVDWREGHKHIIIVSLCHARQCRLSIVEGIIKTCCHIIKKFDIDLDYKIVADYGPIFVHPDYLGKGLQYQMLRFLDEYISNYGYEYAATTVHPDNIYCIHNILKDEFELKGFREFTRGPRNIYLKKVK